MTTIKHLYHGTSAKYLDSIKEKGILPRAITKTKGNWKHTVTSNKDAVYLTDAYAWHFAGAASKTNEKGLILEIDREKLFDWCLCPDEDAIEQATRNQGPPEYPNFAPTEWDMKKRTMFYRKIARHNPQLADASLKHMGTCAYYNEIPLEAITRYVVIEWKKLHPTIHMQAVDSMVSIMNYQILKDRHRALTRWFFGDEVIPEDMTGWKLSDFDSVDNGSLSFMTNHNERMAKAMLVREGLDARNCP